MADWCKNRLEINCDRDAALMKEVLESLLEDGKLTFQKIAPLDTSTEMSRSDLTEWRLSNWGTPHEPYSCHTEQDEGEATIEINFVTSYTPPAGAIHKLREKFPDATITMMFDNRAALCAGYI